MLHLDATADINAATAFLSDLSRRHVPFAVSLALNRTAAEARDAVRESLPHRFSIRRPWVAKGIGVARSSKNDLEAAVFSRDAFMADQEDGGKRGGTQIIPVGRMAHIHAGRVIPKSQWPKAHYAHGAVYHAGTLFERKGRELRPLFLFRKQVRVAPRFGMSLTVQGVVTRRFGGILLDAMGEALRG